MYSLPQPPPGPKPVVVRFARVSRLSVILPPHSVRFQQNLYNTWGLLLDINQADEGLLSRQRLQICADRIGAQGCPLPGLWGFIDGTVRPTARPRNNSFALHNSVLHPWLNQHSRDPKGKDILLFGDKGYGGTGFNLEMSRRPLLQIQAPVFSHELGSVCCCSLAFPAASICWEDMAATAAVSSALEASLRREWRRLALLPFSSSPSAMVSSSSSAVLAAAAGAVLAAGAGAGAVLAAGAGAGASAAAAVRACRFANAVAPP
ncbi:unnamed protein product [Tilletia controversa]|nr:unnamed protein product [Tilletia controversa]